jgi:hypothetical protein
MATEVGVTNDRSLCLVSGYHAVSYPPVAAYEAGMRHRFAVVLDTYRRDKIDMFFDSSLALLLVPALCQIIRYDQLSIRMAGGATISSIEELARHYSGLEEVDRDPPACIEVWRGGAIGAIVQTEWWSSVGGPSPYHDSYTISFYTANDHSSEFRQAIEDLCLAAGASITGFYREEQAKQPYSYLPWWKKAWDWIASL